MGVPFIPGSPTFGYTPTQAAFGTILTQLVFPYSGPSAGAALLYQVTGAPSAVAGANSVTTNWLGNQPYSHLTSLIYTTAGTAHTVTVMRPLNFTFFPNGLPKNTTVIPNGTGAGSTGIYSDPGLYTTSYLYNLPGAVTAPAAPSNQAISSTNKFVAYQLADGSWRLDTIASGTFNSTLTLTTGTPNTTNGNIPAGSPLFYFGTTTLLDPRTNLAQSGFLTIASQLKQDLLAGFQGSSQGSGAGLCTYNAGDPLLVHSNNATATGIIEFVGGSYCKF